MATDSPPLRITSPADILAYIPHALGFGPVESLVMVTLSGRTIGATLRVDLPPPGDDPRAFAAGVCSYLCSDEGADATLMVLYTDEGWDAPATPPRQAMAGALGQALAAARMPLKDAWLVSATHWREYFCVDPDCCPWPGRPVTSIEESALSVELIFGGSSVSASAELAVDRALASAPLDPALRETVGHRVSAYARACTGRWQTEPQFLATLKAWDDHITRPDSVEPDMLDPDTAAFLLASLTSKAVRDSVLVLAGLGFDTAVRGARACALLQDSSPGETRLDPVVPPQPARGPAGPRALEPEQPALPPQPAPGPGAASGGYDPVPLDPHGSEEAARAFAELLAGRYEGRPRWERVDAASALLLQLGRLSTGEGGAAAYSMLAWFEYARGRCSRACAYLDHAEATEPGYRLARLLRELILHGGVPLWARRRHSAWGPGPDAARGRHPGPRP